VVAKFRGRSSVSKRKHRIFYVQKFNFKNLSEAEGKEQYQIKISKVFAALENLKNTENKNKALESNKENINISVKAL
jgi:hypothetical protein